MIVLFEYCNCFRSTSSASTELTQITWNIPSSAEKGILYGVNTFLKYRVRLNSFHFTPCGAKTQSSENSHRVPACANHYKDGGKIQMYPQ